MSGAKGEGGPARTSHRLSGADAWRTHVVLLLGLAFCAVAFWFELGRAEGGNTLSWAYVFEWPLLAVFAVYMWWKVLHEDATPRRRRTREPGLAPQYDGMLKAWQAHQAELAEAERRDIEGAGQTDNASADQSPAERPPTGTGQSVGS